MPSDLAPLLPALCRDLIDILGSLSLDSMVATGNEFLVRLKTAKRSLQIFCALVTRHRKYSDKLMPDMISSALSIVKYSKNLNKLDFLSERIVSLAFDLISHVLETGPGWRFVSPHFSSLLDSAIFPALVMNEKDISEWEEDADEFIRKNLPSEIDEVSGWREDLFTARKSAINLLGVISLSKGPPIGTFSNGSLASSKRKKGEKNKGNGRRSSIGELLVLPFLSKFPIPSEANGAQTEILNNYFGVLLGYGGLLDFLREQEPRYTTTLVRTRLLPLYESSVCLPYIVAPANWVLGELASCLPEEMSADVYCSLLNSLNMPDNGDISCYPVRVSAAGAIAELLENDYMPPDWLSLLQAVIGRIGLDDEDSSILFQLLSSVVEAGNENVAVHIPSIATSLVTTISKCIPADLEPWPQMIEKGFAALAVMAQSWESFLAEEHEQKEYSEKWASGRAAVGRAFSVLLQQAWLPFMHPLEGEGSTPSCIDDASMLLRSIILSVTGSNEIQELKISDLLFVWTDLIADWHAWEESEDMSVFDCIQEVVDLQNKYGLRGFITKPVPSSTSAVPKRSIFEGIGAFVSEAILQYPSATWRACSCVHMFLHVPSYTIETEDVKQSLALSFTRAAFSRFKEVQSKPCSLWKPLLLAIASCYLCYPELVERMLDEDGDGGFAIWLSAWQYVCSSSYEPGLTMESEIKLIVMTLAKVIERLLEVGKPCGHLLNSLLEAFVRFIEMEEEGDEVEEDEDDEEADSDEDVDEETEDDDEDSEVDEHEETEEEFLNRYAKAAVGLQDGTIIEEGDVEEQDHVIELGGLNDIDPQMVVQSLLKERCHLVLQQGHTPPPQLISSVLDAFPGFRIFFPSLTV